MEDAEGGGMMNAVEWSDLMFNCLFVELFEGWRMDSVEVGGWRLEVGVFTFYDMDMDRQPTGRRTGSLLVLALLHYCIIAYDAGVNVNYVIGSSDVIASNSSITA